MLRTLASVSNQIMLSFGVFDSFLITKAIQYWGEFYIILGKANGSSFTWRIQALELYSPLPKSNQECNEGKQRKKSNMKKFNRTATVGHILSTSWNSFYAYYVLFWSTGSQESNALNSTQIRAEMKKLWPLEANRTKLKDNFAATKSQYSSCEINLFVWNGDFQLVKFCSPCCMLQNPPECFQIFATDSFRFFLQIFVV